MEDSGSDHLIYTPSQKIVPQKLMTKYEKYQDSEVIASVTSGKEIKKL